MGGEHRHGRKASLLIDMGEGGRSSRRLYELYIWGGAYGRTMEELCASIERGGGSVYMANHIYLILQKALILLSYIERKRKH